MVFPQLLLLFPVYLPDIVVEKVMLHDVVNVPYNIDLQLPLIYTESLALLQAYSGKGYSWYN